MRLPRFARNDNKKGLALFKIFGNEPFLVIARRGGIPSLCSEQAWQSHNKKVEQNIYPMGLPRFARNDRCILFPQNKYDVPFFHFS